MATNAQTEPRTMTCMEVWGGNQPADRGVVMPGLSAFVYARPVGGEAGGDVHYVSSCATGRITRMLVADVAGHGAHVAATADRLRGLMRRYINYLDQASFVRALNEQFGRFAREGRFATALCLTYWAPTRIATFCNAGHPRPLLYHGRSGQWQTLDATTVRDTPANLPLGVLKAIEYEQFHQRLEPGDLLLLYTDSALEARGPDGRELGEAGLIELISRLDCCEPESLIAQLAGALADWAGRDELEDDLTLMLVAHNDVQARSGVSAWLEASGRVAKEVVTSIGRKPVPWPDWRLETFGGVVSKRLNERWGGSGQGQASDD